MKSIVGRAGWPLAIKVLPALYGAGLVLFVVRILPAAEFGQYGLAFAYINLCAGMARGLWLPQLVTQAAVGRYDQIAGPALRFALAAAVASAAGALLLLPQLGAGVEVAALAAAILLMLVPRDYALGLAQAGGRGQLAFTIELLYFAGALSGFVLLWSLDHLASAFAALAANAMAALLSSAVGAMHFSFKYAVWRSGSLSSILKSSRQLGAITLGDMALQQGDVLLVGAFLSPGQIAPYVAARTLVRLYSLFSQAANFVLLPVASRLSAAREYMRLRSRTEFAILALLGVLVPVNLMVWLAAGWLLPAILGTKYAAAVPYFRVLLLITLFEPVYSLVTNAMVGSGRPQSIVPVTWSGVFLSFTLLLTLVNTIGLMGAPLSIVGAYAALAAGAIYVLRTRLVMPSAVSLDIHS